jgi:sugar phosphate permease
MCPQIRWLDFISHGALWSIYIAHFAMNWSNYIIMQWLPTYLKRSLGGNDSSLSLTAVPYLFNSLCGVGEYFPTLAHSDRKFFGLW